MGYFKMRYSSTDQAEFYITIRYVLKVSTTTFDFVFVKTNSMKIVTEIDFHALF